MTNFTFDGAHSSLEFQIKHLMVSKVKGSFDQFDVAVEGDINDFSTLKATTTIIPSSINTKNEARDNHLKSGDFFGTDEFDKITFVTKSITENKVVGDLTIKGITNEETFDVEFNGVSKNPMDGSQVTGIIVTGTINREKYGINFNQALETGGVMLGKDVKFEASAEFSISESSHYTILIVLIYIRNANYIIPRYSWHFLTSKLKIIFNLIDNNTIK